MLNENTKIGDVVVMTGFRYGELSSRGLALVKVINVLKATIDVENPYKTDGSTLRFRKDGTMPGRKLYSSECLRIRSLKDVETVEALNQEAEENQKAANKRYEDKRSEEAKRAAEIKAKRLEAFEKVREDWESAIEVPVGDGLKAKVFTFLQNAYEIKTCLVVVVEKSERDYDSEDKKRKPVYSLTVSGLEVRNEVETSEDGSIKRVGSYASSWSSSSNQYASIEEAVGDLVRY